MTDIKQQALELYSMYPRRVGKIVALFAIEKAIRQVGYESIKVKVEKYTEIVKNTDEKNLQFVMNPATWFNQGRWDDDANFWLLQFPPKKKRIRPQDEPR